MPTPPARIELADTYPNPSNAVFRAGMGKFWDYVTTLLGASGTPAAARTALGVAIGSDVQAHNAILDGIAAKTILAGHGQCLVSKSGSNLLLSRFNGSSIVINGTPQQIPTAGVTLAPPATTLTLYYIYAYMNGTTMTLEASTTTHATDATTGVEIKSGDATRTLVGFARTVTNAWVDTVSQRFVRSWFNDPGVSLQNRFTTARQSAVTSGYGEISSEIQCQFLSWAGETISAKVGGTNYNSGATNSNYTAIAIDSTTAGEYGGCLGYAAGASGGVPVSCASDRSAATEGYHYVTVLGYVTAGTGTWVGSSAGAHACQLNVSVG